ncbi:tRNA (adenine(22)-N(1))-methyltransferase TrmK [Sporosarcina sp. Te-1]|uniref:tRNA (adenine(22)-N(1))-methyltransferase n=1 Tax=Sporosarcina sp. Te-1 TaxID=2818390 RepID=UPI001A9DE7CF|nr:tRNA (adenine(22)-N(1))-methyltransferase TrmK [Sporosarcina sp. Te-1]QTD41673.1 tRNA (adenine-N(1))-methyltransferase [Sporosarcina sp. Te-1]
MNPLKLSERLATVASFIEKGAVMADIGSDHAYLPCHLVRAGAIERAVAGEVAKGPYESAVANVAKEGLSEVITVRLANGLAAIRKEDEVDAVTIAGMGGTLIAGILEDGKARLEGVKRIIAQPNIHAIAIRSWCQDNGWTLVDERILKEDDKIYEVLVLERGEAAFSEVELLVGPFLMAEKSLVFMEKWTRELEEWKRVLRAIETAGHSEDAEKKKVQLQAKIEMVGKVLSN